MTVLAAALVAAVLVFAIARPRGLPEIVVAVPAAAVAVAVGLVSLGDAGAEIAELAPTVGFLAAILVLAHLADAHGVFTWTASLLRRGANGSPPRLLAWVFVAAAIVTSVLSLDATVVLLTPAVIGAAAASGMRSRPHSYAVAHLSNSASTLLPVSNLTNLLAFAATGLTFLHFTALMTLPWIAAIVVEFVIFRLFFRRDLAVPATDPEPLTPEPAPTAALIVIGCALAGFAVSGFVGIEPVWVAAVAAVLLAVSALRSGRSTPLRILRAADVWFCAFVFALGVVVASLAGGPAGDWLASIVPTGTSFLALLGAASIAAIAANVVNNLPATLLLVAAVGTSAPPALILAVLVGVNLGPNLTYVGSLAIMLWRRVTGAAGVPADLRTFTVLGLIATPATLVASVSALWLSTQLF